MSKKTFDKIAEGLTEALAIARGEKKPARLSTRSHVRREPTLTDEQLAEVRRRRRRPEPQTRLA